MDSDFVLHKSPTAPAEAATNATVAAAIAATHTANTMPTESTRLVDGSDLRLGMPGGVFVAHGSAVDAMALPGKTGTAWTLATCIRIDGPITEFFDGWVFGEALNTNHKALFFKPNGALNRLPEAPLSPGWHWIVYVRDGFDFSVYVDGSLLVSWNQPYATDTIPLQYLAAGYCSRRELVVFNRALTDAERKAVMRGETPAGLATRGVSKQGPWANGTGSYQPFVGLYSSTGPGSVSGATGVGGIASYGFAQSGISGSAGEVFIVTGTIDSLTAGVLRIAAYDSAGSYASNVHAVTTVGPFSAVLTAFANFSDVAISINGEDAKSFSATISTCGILGTVARYEPQNVTSRGRWLDSSGNDYDLLPGTGITPLNPQPVQVRQATIIYDTVTPNLISATSGWGAVKVVTGSGYLTYPAFLNGMTITAIASQDDNSTPCIMGARQNTGANRIDWSARTYDGTHADLYGAQFLLSWKE